MYKSFTSLDELFAHIEEDKNWTGAEVGLHNRYPVRFVLFDNFSDFNYFIENRPEGIFTKSLDKILDEDYPDTFLTYTELSLFVRDFVKQIPASDYVIFPFSEMARFYDNTDSKEFDALIKTVRGTQAPAESQNRHLRIYIPIVGMQGKMGKFMKDNITFVWEYKSGFDKGVYNLVVTDGTTYGVSGLEDKYTVVNDLNEWIKLWEKGDKIKQTIICSSPNIYANVKYAQPDNAFKYRECQNAYQFLTKGLGLDFGVKEEPLAEEMPHWEQLSGEIDVSTFCFEEFVKERLDTYALNDGMDFIKSWFDCENGFDRWLLALYFRHVADKNSYIYKAVTQCASLTKSELFSTIATLIFEETNREHYASERLCALTLAAEHDVQITDAAKQDLTSKLCAIASSKERGGYYSAVKLLTAFTDEERQLAILWVAQGHVSLNDIQKVFPKLYSYMKPLDMNSLSHDSQWVNAYIDAYRWSKLANEYSDRIESLIKDKNASPASFMSWKDNFKTVKTILHNRKDIDVFYWIDGLGVDWIPFIRDIVAKYSKEHVYLNELYIGLADVPTTTSNNKPKLQSLLPEGGTLPKIGDVDSYAHSSKKYPQYIIEEMNIVEKAITSVLDNYTGKKIAFVSDHGITYLSQFQEGLNIAGIEANHEGRCGKITGGTFVADKKYIILEDGKTVCSLTHKSLTSKVDKSHGAHGGCSPEEVLVPIVIVSPNKNANTYSVKLLSDEVNGNAPVASFIIKGLSSVDVPTVRYNDVEYKLKPLGDDRYETERLNLVDTATKIFVYINNEQIDNFSIKISTGATEEDLFGDDF